MLLLREKDEKIIDDHNKKQLNNIKAEQSKPKCNYRNRNGVHKENLCIEIT